MFEELRISQEDSTENPMEIMISIYDEAEDENSYGELKLEIEFWTEINMEESYFLKMNTKEAKQLQKFLNDNL